MKLTFVVILLSICSVASFAQSVADAGEAAGLLVTKNHYKLKVQQYRVGSRENAADELQRVSTSPQPTENDANVGLHSMERTKPVTRSRFLFLYSAEVKNVGVKKIVGVVWDYVFIRAADDTELGRLRLVSTSGIKPDKSKLISVLTSERPPVREASMVVHIDDLDRKLPPYTEKVEIKCIVYADGTAWHHPKLATSDCESLIREKHRKER